MPLRLPSILPLLSVLLLNACGHSASEPPVASPPTPPVDFSGHWEKDFGQSDDFTSKYNLYLFDVRRRLSSQVQGEMRFGGGNVSRDAVLGLARFTEELTRGTRLAISHDDDTVAVAREGDFTLRCQGFGRGVVRSNNAFGQELCGWNGEQLLFRHDLEGLSVLYQLTLGPEGQQLNLTTTVSSAAVASPLVISTYYRRFQPADEGYDCELTLSRLRVCRQLEVTGAP